MDFTVEGARNLLSAFQRTGYTFHAFGDDLPATGAILLRHDVDLDLEDALTVAQIEADMDISAHYFVLVTSPLYNIRSRTGMRILREIVSLGHRVGVHIDPAAYADTSPVPQEALGTHLRDEADIIESITGADVTAFSLHRPSDWNSEYPEDLSGLTSAYASRYFSDIRYSSDSEGWWRYGSFLRSAEFDARRSVQLLLHPEWWTGDPGEEPGQRLDRLIRTRAGRYCDDVVSTINPYGPYLRGGDGSWPDASITRPRTEGH